MKRCLLLALAGPAIGLTMPTLAQPNESAPSEQDRQQLDALAARYAEATNRHDAAAIVSLFTEEGVFVSPEGILSGRQAIEKLYRDTFTATAAAVSDQPVSLFAEALNRPELKLAGLLVPWIAIVGALGFLAAWLAVAILERTGLARRVWHLPLYKAFPGSSFASPQGTAGVLGVMPQLTKR